MSQFLIILGSIWIFALLILVAVYVVGSLAAMKALKYLKYPNAWMAWVPYLRYYALTDVLGLEVADLNFGLNLDMKIFKFWWVLLIVLPFIPGIGYLATVAVNVVCLGYVYGKVYQMIGADDPDTCKMLGYVSGLIGIVAIVKFLTIKADNN